MGNVEKIIAEVILEMMQPGTEVGCIGVGFPSEIMQNTYDRLKQEGRLDDPTCMIWFVPLPDGGWYSKDVLYFLGRLHQAGYICSGDRAPVCLKPQGVEFLEKLASQYL